MRGCSVPGGVLSQPEPRTLMGCVAEGCMIWCRYGVTGEQLSVVGLILETDLPLLNCRACTLLSRVLTGSRPSWSRKVNRCFQCFSNPLDVGARPDGS